MPQKTKSSGGSMRNELLDKLCGSIERQLSGDPESAIAGIWPEWAVKFVLKRHRALARLRPLADLPEVAMPTRDQIEAEVADIAGKYSSAEAAIAGEANSELAPELKAMLYDLHEREAATPDPVPPVLEKSEQPTGPPASENPLAGIQIEREQPTEYERRQARILNFEERRRERNG
nr:hypothetical protein 10 [Desulfobacteraceae bacterium]